MRHFRSLTILLALFCSSYSFGFFHLDAGTSMGVTRANAAGDDPVLGQYGINASFGLSFLGVFAGITSEFRAIEQYSDVDSASGNYQGTYLNPVGLVAGYGFDPFLVKVDFKFLGTYDLSNTADDGTSVKFTDPTGYRLTVLYDWGLLLYAGVHYEVLRFSKVKRSGDSSEKLDSAQKMDQIGMSLTYAL